MDEQCLVELYRAVSRVLKRLGTLPSVNPLRNICRNLKLTDVEPSPESRAAIVTLIAALGLWKKLGFAKAEEAGKVDPRRLVALESTFEETIAHLVSHGLSGAMPDGERLRVETAYLGFVEDALSSLSSCCDDREVSALERGCQAVEAFAPTVAAESAKTSVGEGGAAVTATNKIESKRGLLFLEFGVYRGKSIRVIARAAAGIGMGSRVVGFDSFEGLPSAWRPGFPVGAFGISGVEATATISALERDFPGVLELRRGLFKDSVPVFLREEFGVDGEGGVGGGAVESSRVGTADQALAAAAGAASAAAAAATAVLPATTAATAGAEATRATARPPAARPRLAMVHVDCDLYKSAATVLTLLSNAGVVEPGLVLVFDELVNFDLFLAHEMRALFELVQRLNAKSRRFRVEWIGGRRGDMSRACRLVACVDGVE